MNTICKIILLYFLTTVSTPLIAALKLKGEIVDGEFGWDDSTTYTSNGMTSSAIKYPVGPLVNTNSWTPGLSINQNTIVFNSVEGTDSVEIPLLSVGIELGWSSDAAIDADIPNAVPSCPLSSVSSGSYVIAGTTSKNCFGIKRIVYQDIKQPFNMLGPLFEFDKSSIAARFKDKAQGVYIGQFNLRYRIAYKNNSGIVTYRQLVIPTIFEIYNNKAFVESVDTYPDTLSLDPEYNKANSTISASDLVNVRVNGYFNQGLTLRLGLNDYYLFYESDRSRKIPLSIDCSGCSPSSLVSEGRLISNTSNINPQSDYLSEFSLRFYFQTPLVDDLLDGRYSNIIDFYIEAKL